MMGGGSRTPLVPMRQMHFARLYQFRAPQMTLRAVLPRDPWDTEDADSDNPWSQAFRANRAMVEPHEMKSESAQHVSFMRPARLRSLLRLHDRAVCVPSPAHHL